MSGAPADEYRCTARKKNKERCGSYSALGTDVCKRHGAAAKQVKQKGLQRLAVRKLGLPVDIDPAQALLNLVAQIHGEVLYWTGIVEDIEPDAVTWGKVEHQEGFGPMGSVDVTTERAGLHQALVALHDSQDRLARVAKMALEAGVEQRRIDIAEKQAAVFATAIHAILTGLQLTPEQQDLVPTVVPNALRSIEP